MNRNERRTSKPFISIVGLGYVGLSTAVCFAHRGFNVYGIDVDPRRIATIESGKVPFFEEKLEPMLRSVLKKKLLRCGGDYKEGVGKSNFIFITVGTPSKPDGDIDLTFVKAASAEIGNALRHTQEYRVVIVKSSVVAGTTEGTVKPIVETSSEKKCGKDFGLCANPEFLREGTAVKDTFDPDAVVIGAVDAQTGKSILGLYKKFFDQMPPTILTRPANAELIKYSVNTFRATQLSYLNTLANLCENVSGADIDEVARGISAVTKVDSRYLKAGLGYGGSCLPKDLRALTAQIDSLGLSSDLLQAVAIVNKDRIIRMLELIRKHVGDIREKRIAVLGLAFKAGTDDVRESAAMELVKALLNAGARVISYDPRAMTNAKALLENKISYAKNPTDCVDGADCCVIATAWEEFGKIRISQFRRLMRNPVLIDCWGIYDEEEMEDQLSYTRIGRNMSSISGVVRR